MKFSLIALLAISITACSQAPNQISSPIGNGRIESNGIVGGESAAAQDSFVNSTVGVIDTASGGACTGTLIADGIVVTAAHCVEGAKVEDMVIGFGLNLEDQSAIFQASANVLGHAKYTEGMAKLEVILQEIVGATEPGPARDKKISEAVSAFKNWGDIALLQVKGAVPAGFVNAKVLENQNIIKKGDTVLLAGYGITKPYSEQQEGEQDPFLLRKVNVKVADPAFSDTEILFDQTNGKGACHGDSGGPAYFKVGNQNMLVGVTSRGINDLDDSCRQYSAYTYLPSYKSWIQSTINSWK